MNKIICLLSLALTVSACAADPAETFVDESPSFAEGEVGTIAWDFGDGTEVPVSYRVIGGLVTFGGDMVLGTVDEVRTKLEAFVSYGAFPANDIPGWPGDRIDFYIRPALSQNTEDEILAAIDQWEARTTLRFVRRYIIPAGVHTLVFENQANDWWLPPCQAQVGYAGSGWQWIRLRSNCNVSGTAHEIGHALGLKQ